MRLLSVVANSAASLALLLSATAAQAAVKTRPLEYKLGTTVMQGTLAWDDAVKGKRPAVLVIHDWMGPGAFSRGRAEELAKLGYVALAADVYGTETRPKDAKEAGAAATLLKTQRPLLRQRAKASLDALLAQPEADAAHVAAIGYCFGGTAALELARSGAAVHATVSLHGGLDSPTPADGKNIKGKVLALHGADDPFVPADQVAAFQKELRDANVDWQLVAYGGAVHAFTLPGAGHDNSKGSAYNAKADKRSWQALRSFLEEALK